MPVIDIATSYRRDDDVAWQAHIINALADQPESTPEYIDRQRDFLGQAARYRPEEVAGAVSHFQDALSFDDSILLGTALLAEMERTGAFG